MSVEKKVCFLVGAPRSGTTWVQRLLQLHPEVCGGEESHFFRLFGPLMPAADDMVKSKKRKIGPLIYTDKIIYENSIRSVWNTIFENLYKTFPESKVHLEKTPDHLLHLNEVLRIFPDAPIIIVLRDSRAVTSSLVKAAKGWGSNWAPKSYKNAAIRWYIYMRAFTEWEKTHPNHPHLVIRYEDALLEPAETIKSILEFLKLNADNQIVQKMLDQYELENATSKDPQGFARFRGSKGWSKDMSLYGKIITWRYTRKMMKEIGYKCQLFR